MLTLLYTLAAAAALQGPAVRGGAEQLLGRRAAVSSAASAFAAGLLSVGGAANAYDAIPVPEADFAAAEKQRGDKLLNDKKLTVELVKLLKAIESSTTEKEFIDSADKLALWVIGKGFVPDGIGIKNLVSRIKLAYDSLPKRSFKCERTRDNNGVCFSPGRGAELAYDSLIKQLRKYTIIQLGDYRRVEFYAF